MFAFFATVNHATIDNIKMDISRYMIRFGSARTCAFLIAIHSPVIDPVVLKSDVALNYPPYQVSNVDKKKSLGIESLGIQAKDKL